MNAWPGHLSITQIALLSILDRAASDHDAFSCDERVLYTACEFWAAVRAGELRAHLGPQPEAFLEAAGTALTQVGAVTCGRLAAAGVDALRRIGSGEHRDAYLADLEARLQGTGENVDAMIGLQARRCLGGAASLHGAALGAVIH